VSAALLAVGWMSAASATASRASLADLSLEELSNIEVTSVSKQAERLSDAAAAVFVITADDVRRSGATRLFDALRLAPNLHVAEVSATGGTVSARGFASSSANKLLVLIDGRSVYTPLFSGVFWDVQNVMLEDIERIEVISGPGGTLWGVNAVNGVVNVITKSARDTPGELVSASTGNEGGDLAFRHGGALAADGAYRVYGQYSTRRHTETAAGLAVDDASHRAQTGFRTDWRSAGDRFSVQGDAYRGREDQPLPGELVTGASYTLGPIDLSGLNLVGKWGRTLDGGGSIDLQATYDHTERTVPPTFAEVLDILDLQFQHASPRSDRHALVWGAELRHSFDDVRNSVYAAVLPPRLQQTWFSVFAQDDITLQPDVRLTAGARVEHNGYTGYEFLPNARIGWKLAADHLLWAAASRTVRAPSRFDRDTYVPVAPGASQQLLRGGPNVRSETAKVFEVGYRGQPTPASNVSVTVFRADYDQLRSQEVDPTRTFIVFANGMQGRTQGIEAWGSWQAAARWRLSAGAGVLHKKLWLKPGSNDFAGLAAAQGQDPRERFQLRSSVDLPHNVELDAAVRRISALTDPDVPDYTAVDVRLAWRPQPGWELSMTGQNLLDPGHGEFTSVTTRTDLGRSVVFKLLRQF
jgi:iron complex outermembrane receptor protein